ncbi:MAG TPA: asparagine--tRNA ligase [Rhodospirillaceae bacterium]|nr:MAG: asparagine--tRNA ligase [Alphaproteobacteria bacterium GWF2_58_20]HAU29940.1 asparagine--tRNA ligase [Rhodospirillaceae bacterium]
MQRTKILHLLASETPMPQVLAKGWVRTRRDAKDFSFIELNDGSCLRNIQVIASDTLPNYEDIKKITTGSAIEVTGKMVESQGQGQKFEIIAENLVLLGGAGEDFPLQKKRHSDEFLRSIAHLRPRSNKFGAAFRIRSEMAWAVHDFFHGRGFRYVHTPIITASDCEGAGEMFKVTTLNLETPPMKDGKVDFSQDFFGKAANLTVSGQLEGEMFALALGDIYTFGPTFRAENSNTRRHAAEFWMIEPEMAFCDLQGDMQLAEDFVRHLVRHALEHCAEDLALFNQFVNPGLLDTLKNIEGNEFVRLPYREAIEIMQNSGKKFEFPVFFGCDMQSEHEQFLTEEHFKRPVIVFDYPEQIKAFYMRMNEDGETVAAMDVLVPGIGELIGGSQREERMDRLTARMEKMGLNPDDYGWYLDSRRYGSVPHAGFGLGFERLLMLVTGIPNIRDVSPFPRVPGWAEF